LHRMFLNEPDRYRERLEYLKINQYPPTTKFNIY
jgi:hypothetical protein